MRTFLDIKPGAEYPYHLHVIVDSEENIDVFELSAFARSRYRAAGKKYRFVFDGFETMLDAWSFAVYHELPDPMDTVPEKSRQWTKGEIVQQDDDPDVEFDRKPKKPARRQRARVNQLSFL